MSGLEIMASGITEEFRTGSGIQLRYFFGGRVKLSLFSHWEFQPQGATTPHFVAHIHVQ